MTTDRAGTRASTAAAGGSAAGASREAQRQRALLERVRGAAFDAAAAALAQVGVRAADGCAAYRANADAIAERALGAAFPTVRALVGAGDFAHLARDFRQRDPPECGDLGEWGARFPDWLGAHAALAEWPYLGDCAHVDFAVHRCERAADARFDAASLDRLDRVDPARLHLKLVPGTAALRSAWPIAAIRAAHDGGDFAAVRAAVAARRAECVLVARSGWRATVQRIDATTFEWTRMLLEGVDVASALDRAGPGFDFAAWFATALRAGWLQGVDGSAD